MNRFFLLINISLLLISCNSERGTQEKKVFRYNSSNGITSLDPAFARTQENIRAVNQLFNGLVQLDDSLNVIPCIAKEWTISEDGLVYTFTLRNDVFFHKHQIFNDVPRKVTGSDFAYSFNRIISPQTASDGAWIFNGIVSKNNPFEAPNDTTFRITLSKPYAPLISMLTMAYCYVVPKDAVEKFGDSFGKTPIGTGPFRFANWQEGIKLNFISNADYFETERKPKIDALSISFIQSKQTELLEFIQGKLSVFSGIESSFKDEILNAEGELNSKYSNEFNLRKYPFLNTEYLAFNLEDNSSIIQHKEIRKAMSLAVDRASMTKFLRNNVGIPSNGGFIPTGLPSHYTYTQPTFNVDSAKKILANSGIDLKQELKLTTTKDYLDLCVLVQKNLADIGITIKIDVVPSSLLKQQKSAGDVSFFRSSWIADYPDGENYLSCFYSKNKAPNGPNYTRLNNQEFDALYEQLIAATTTLEQQALSTKLELILQEECPFINLFYDQSIWITHKNLKHLKVNALNHIDLTMVEI